MLVFGGVAFVKEIFSRNHLLICPLEASSKQAEKAEGSKGAKTMEAGFGVFFTQVLPSIKDTLQGTKRPVPANGERNQKVPAGMGYVIAPRRIYRT